MQPIVPRTALRHRPTDTHSRLSSHFPLTFGNLIYFRFVFVIDFWFVWSFERKGKTNTNHRVFEFVKLLIHFFFFFCFSKYIEYNSNERISKRTWCNWSNDWLIDCASSRRCYRNWPLINDIANYWNWRTRERCRYRIVLWVIALVAVMFINDIFTVFLEKKIISSTNRFPMIVSTKKNNKNSYFSTKSALNSITFASSGGQRSTTFVSVARYF